MYCATRAPRLAGLTRVMRAHEPVKLSSASDGSLFASERYGAWQLRLTGVQCHKLLSYDWLRNLQALRLPFPYTVFTTDLVKNRDALANFQGRRETVGRQRLFKMQDSAVS